MPDGRFVSRGISQSEQLARVCLKADFLFGRCIPHLDRDGRMSGNPSLVKSTACPLRDEITVEDVPELLRSLAGEGLLKWYAADGKQVLEFPGFERNQRGLKYEREAESRFPSSTSKGAQDLCRIESCQTPAQVRTEVGVSPPKLSEVKLSPSSEGADPDLVRSSESQPALPRAPRAAGKPTDGNGTAWISPYWDPWKAMLGGDPPKIIVKAFQPLQRAPEWQNGTLLRRWVNFITGLKVNPKYLGSPVAQIRKFVATHAAYDDPDWYLSDRERASLEGLFG